MFFPDILERCQITLPAILEGIKGGFIDDSLPDGSCAAEAVELRLSPAEIIRV